MPSASTSTLRMPSASMSSLSHSMKVRSAMAPLPIGTVSVSGRSVRTKPPTCWDRWRGKPISCSARLRHGAAAGRSGRARPRPRAPCRHRVPQLPQTVPASAAGHVLGQAHHLADLADGACAGGSGSRWRRARRGRGHTWRRCTGSPPRAARARSRRRYRAAPCALREMKRSNSRSCSAGSTAVMPSSSRRPSWPPSRAPGRGWRVAPSRAKRTMSWTVRK